MNKCLKQIAIASLCLLLASCTQQPKHTFAQFWQWFQANEDRLYHYEHKDPSVLKEVGDQLTMVNDSLVWEMGPIEKNGKREFIVSPGGIKEAFPVASALVDAAPSLPHWKWVKYKQRHVIGPYEKDGNVWNPKDVRFTLQKSGDDINVSLYMKDYRGAQDYMKCMDGVFMLLDGALGEEDVALRMGTLDVKPLTDAPAEAKQFSELPASFDALLGRKAATLDPIVKDR